MYASLMSSARQRSMVKPAVSAGLASAKTLVSAHRDGGLHRIAPRPVD